MSLSVVIVEDEPLACSRLSRFVEADDRLHLLGVAADGISGIRLVDELLPDLIFLDVELPEHPGHDIVTRAAHQPMVIYTTAYSEHAVRAFELGAVDYLVKPFGARRFAAAVDRAVRMVAAAGPHVQQQQWLDRIFVARGTDTVPLRTNSVIRLEAAGDYVRVHTAAGVFMTATPLSVLSGLLDPRSFLRVHRMHAVNLDQVIAIRQYDGRRVLVKTADNAEIVASRAGSQALKSLQRLEGS
jgi:two-component system, LytTR family, response regulator